MKVFVVLLFVFMASQCHAGLEVGYRDYEGLNNSCGYLCHRAFKLYGKPSWGWWRKQPPRGVGYKARMVLRKISDDRRKRMTRQMDATYDRALAEDKKKHESCHPPRRRRRRMNRTVLWMLAAGTLRVVIDNNRRDDPVLAP